MRASAKATSRATLAAFGLALLVGTAAQCGYNPSPPNGQLGCSAKSECPEGYACDARDNKCWKNGTGGVAGVGGNTAGAGGAAGTGGTTGGTPVDDYIGRWIFDAATSTMTVVGCGSDGTPMSFTDFMDVEVGPTPGTIKATYYCPWILSTPTSGGAATVGPGQLCTGTDPKTNYVFTWRATTFTFTTSDGKSATLSSLIAASYVAPNASTGTCTVRITGKLTK